ncbi:MAG TPA: ParB/RepB/Spo0J family partition protein [Opitutales bacterium]|nr:ParB/RepB/Spo0J family partition protein [Opitutales bacterium]
MANGKTRLGRGLSGLISGGITSPSSDGKTDPAKSASKKAASKKPVSKKVATTKKVPPPAAPELPGYAEIPVSQIEPNPFQPRREFDSEQLQELSDSIRSEGLLQPIVVRRVGNRYQLIAGERRWRACKNLQLKTIPARIIDANDASSASISLIENLQRAELNPVEESLGYASLIRDFDLTQEEVAERVGKGRATVANALRLLQLNAEIRGYLGKGMISVGHAKLLLGLEEEAEQTLLARKIIEEGLSVRSVERLIKNLKNRKAPVSAGERVIAKSEESAVKDIEKQIASRLNTRVALKHSPKKGRIVIEYYGNDDLHRILERIGINS